MGELPVPRGVEEAPSQVQHCHFVRSLRHQWLIPNKDAMSNHEFFAAKSGLSERKCAAPQGLV